MKILGISAGTRNGNNDSMCKEALMGAKLAGAEVEFIRLLDLDIKHCTGCTVCVRTLMSGQGGICTLKDDFEWIKDKILDADGLIFSVPIFVIFVSIGSTEDFLSAVFNFSIKSLFKDAA